MGISGIKRFAQWAYQHAGEPYLAPLLYIEQRTQKGPVNERGVEYGYALNELSKHRDIKHVLDVGSGDSSWPHLLSYCGYKVTAIDYMRLAWGDDYWHKRAPYNRHFRIKPEDITYPRHVPHNFDAITCISTLEHIKQYELALQNMAWLLRMGGHLILTVPCTEKEYRADVYEHEIRKYICQSFTLKHVESWDRYYFGHLEERRFYAGWTGEYWNEGERISPPIAATPADMNLGCFHFVKVKE